MGEPNWANRTIFTGDNLDVMRGMNSESVDLIYLDPPFNSDSDYEAPVGSPAEGAGFRDIWTLDDVKLEEHGELAERNPALYAVIDAAGLTHGKSMKAYLIMMGTRLLEIQRILKPNGSIYLHCDDTAGAYLKATMDATFGAANFRNEIVWQRTTARSDGRKWGRVNDTLLYYVGGPGAVFVKQYTPHREEYIAQKYRHDDGDGRGPYRLDNMVDPRGNDKGLYEWKGYEPPAKGWRFSRETMARLDAEGRIHYPDSRSKRLQLKRYLSETRGRVVNSNWVDVKVLNSQAKERTMFRTQKPLPLLERIIKASSKEGDIVFDPFCGCATACVAAEDLRRQWVGIDIAPKAVELVIQRFTGTKQLTLLANRIIHREDIPRRTDLGVLPNYRTHKHTLFGRQEGLCAGCRHAFPFRNFTIDHVVPKASGGPDHLDNLQLLCNACNSMKGTRSQAEFRAELKRIGITGS